MNPLMPNVSLTELDLFLRVGKLKSLRECSRQLNMTPGAISKVLKRLEQKLDATLMTRSISGIVLTSEGSELIQMAEKMLQLAAQASPKLGRRQGFKEKVWGIGAVSFLSSRLISQCVPTLARLRPNTRFRVVEFTTNELVSYGLNGAFEIAVHGEPLEWTRVWSTHEIGALTWGLFAATNHPLTKLKSVAESDVIRYPFTMPTQWTTQGFLRGDDQCPVPWGRRFPGHEAVTAETSLEIVQASQQLTFVPSILAQRSLNANLVRQLKVKDWPSVQKSIYLSIRDDLISKPFLQSLTDVIGRRLRTPS